MWRVVYAVVVGFLCFLALQVVLAFGFFGTAALLGLLSLGPLIENITLRRSVRVVLLTLKAISAIIYILAAVVLLYLAAVHEQQLFPSAGSIIVLGIMAFRALYFVNSPGRPLSLSQGAMVTLLSLVSVLLLLLPSTTAGNSDPASREDPSGLPYLLSYGFWVIFLGLRYLDIRIIYLVDLDKCKLDYLVLRSFVFDNISKSDPIQGWSHLFWRLISSFRWLPVIGELVGGGAYDLRFGSTYESLLRSGLCESGVAASVHNPQWRWIPPVTGVIIGVRRDEDWRDVVKRAIGVSRYVIATPGVTDGLKEELLIVRHHGLGPGHCLLLVPFDADSRLCDAYLELVRQSGMSAPGELRPGGLYAFSPDWSALEIACGIETALEAAREIEAWSYFGAIGEPRWCEVDQCRVQPSALGRCPNCGLILDSERALTVWPTDPVEGWRILPPPACSLPDGDGTVASADGS